MGAEQTGGEGGGDRGDREPPVAGRVGIDGSGVVRHLDAGARAVLGEAAEHLVGRRLLDAAEAGGGAGAPRGAPRPRPPPPTPPPPPPPPPHQQNHP